MTLAMKEHGQDEINDDQQALAPIPLASVSPAPQGEANEADHQGEANNEQGRHGDVLRSTSTTGESTTAGTPRKEILVPRLTKLRDWMARRGTPTATEAAAVTTDHLSALTGDLEQALQVRWWHWRHLFLEAKKLQLEEQTHES